MQQNSRRTEDAWTALTAELDRWHAAGRIAGFWWRDDDAVAPGPRLDRLLDLTAGRPLALAVIPALAERPLADRLADAPDVAVLVHGWRHADHAPAGAKKAEFGADRPRSVMLDEAGRGLDRLGGLMPDRLAPVFVPPWNRIDPDLADRLPAAGYRAVSAYKARAAGAGDRWINCHADPIAWKAGRGFVGDAAALSPVIEHLAARRTGTADPSEPTGMLTHHGVQDESVWAFLARFRDALDDHPAARFVSVMKGLS